MLIQPSVVSAFTEALGDDVSAVAYSDVVRAEWRAVCMWAAIASIIIALVLVLWCDGNTTYALWAAVAAACACAMLAERYCDLSKRLDPSTSTATASLWLAAHEAPRTGGGVSSLWRGTSERVSAASAAGAQLGRDFQARTRKIIDVANAAIERMPGALASGAVKFSDGLQRGTDAMQTIATAAGNAVEHSALALSNAAIITAQTAAIVGTSLGHAALALEPAIELAGRVVVRVAPLIVL